MSPMKASVKAKTAYDEERLKSGIPGLDEMIEGGFVKDSTVVLHGRSGAGKTLFCLQYLYTGATEYDEPGVYMSFSEPESAIHRHARRFGWDMRGLIKKKRLAILRYQPHEIVKIVEEGGSIIGDTIQAMGAKRLVIDSLTAYEMLFEHSYKANESVLALFELLRRWQTTVLVTSETSVSPHLDTESRLGFLTDGIINLYYLRTNSHRSRAIEIVKMRDTVHTDKIKIFGIKKSGLRVYDGITAD
ncbi:MAG: ATPase domain-containing protein [Candidatus Micrarchaeota archaeon]